VDPSESDGFFDPSFDVNMINMVLMDFDEDLVEEEVLL